MPPARLRRGALLSLLQARCGRADLRMQRQGRSASSASIGSPIANRRAPALPLIPPQELRGKRKAEDLVWKTPEGINIKPLYTAEDVEVSHEAIVRAKSRAVSVRTAVNPQVLAPCAAHCLVSQGTTPSQIPGEYPYTRGPRATMYTYR